MKTLLISEIFPPKIGGSGRWFWEIYSRLDYESYIIAAGKDAFATEFDLQHCLCCIRWPLAFSSWGLLSFSAIVQYLKLIKLLHLTVKLKHISVIHCGRGLPEGLLGWLAWKWLGIPYLCYVHGEELPTYHSSRQYKLLSQLVYANAHRIVVNSNNTHRSFVKYTGLSDTVHIMHPGVDTSYFTPANRNEEISRKYGWSGRKVVLTVGRLQKRKGHDHVILAMERIRQSIPNVLYSIVGDGEELGYLESLVTSHGLGDYVQLLGKVDDATMLACYQQCDLFVLANREVDGDFEGFGMVLVEAQSCGKPVVAGMSGGTAETMIQGYTGMLVDAESPEAIADTLTQLLSDDEILRVMGHFAAEWVRRKFDWNVLIRQAEGIFSELSSKR
ncbi:glycosyltransferase family 4 protein [Pelobacter propionicus]|uniref:Glycosyl transferase, group 1 n=1 Tax=Pelobacter propionicus (strain DSM 2379 / NBRC 103807 / OttBd1) TaxID=338966 RepID=A1ARU2_PELPD|nr:glycosyltransferase family 4 protein [Pelobacter propionicus]ABL00063.1 glycosyl transferase, group 1 [Pelobacter propionicus DSM 2379]